MKPVRFPPGFRVEGLLRDHRRREFRSGQDQVDDWLATKAWQNQEKCLSVTKVLLTETDEIAGYFTLATGQVDFSDLPADISRKLPQRALPAAVLAWLGVGILYQGRGLGQRLLAQALRDCFEAGETFAFVAVILDCIDDRAKAFYQHWGFSELPGHSYRLYLSAKQLKALVAN